MTAVTVLTNPTAGNGRAPRVSEAVIARLRERGAHVTTIEGRTPGDALESTRRAVRAGCEALVAVGGDGLVNLALQAVATTATALAVAPAGTGNDFARLLGVPLDSPSAAADIVMDHTVRSIDLGRAQDRWFATVLSTGFDSLVTERANRMRWPTGPLRYALAVMLELTKLRPIAYRMEIDGRVLEFDATLVTVGNGPTYGGGLAICPAAAVDDGLLDVTIVVASSRTRLVRRSPTLFQGTHVSLPEVETHRAKSVLLAAPGMTAYADGERFSALPVRIESVSRAANVLVGRSSPLA
ncbi:diacylglycerol kinase [Rhodococcus sp. G-MC3]|uniref:diacylglycerol kinase n=1 Tax=Rhodococcus sp. G-MC3 TaxID=3046209 RepID=UPI0024BB4BB5|nr:diacylglycerol kinase [Rhodococcus sp. G-MC3]MDJ0391790.1 diacylglycerol kinase [Rhodococcus sp. G-MC3]